MKTKSTKLLKKKVSRIEQKKIYTIRTLYVVGYYHLKTTSKNSNPKKNKTNLKYQRLRIKTAKRNKN